MQTTQSIGRYLLLLSDERCAFGVASTTSLVAGGSAECRTLEWVDSAPAVGFEPTTNRLTADRSTTELRWIVRLRICGLICCVAIPERQLPIPIIASTDRRTWTF